MDSIKMNSTFTPRAVVTGIGVQCSFAHNYEQFKNELRQFTQNREQTNVITLANQERAIRMDHEKIKTETLCDFNEYGFDSVKEALQNAKLSLDELEKIKHSVGLVYATSTEDTNALLYKTFNEEQAEHKGRFPDYLQKKIPFHGSVTVCDSSCSAGGIAAGTALDLIRFDNHKVVLLGGIEVITLMQHSGFSILGALGSIGSQPFSEARDGVGLGSASVFLIVEEYEYAKARGASILGEIAGYGMGNDAYHITAPHPKGVGARFAMQRAMKEAGITSSQITYINSHGTGTEANDAMELHVIGEQFNEQPIYVSSIKGLTGHTLSSAGVIELAASMIALNEQFIIPNFELEQPMEHEEQIILPTASISMQYDYAISNSFAFGGNCVCVVIKRAA